MLTPDLELEQSSDSPDTSPTLSSVCCSALALVPSSQGHGQGERLCPQVYCWEALAGAHSLPNARPFQSLVSILVLAQPACLARLVWRCLVWNPRTDSGRQSSPALAPVALLASVNTNLKSLSWPPAPISFLLLPQCPDNLMDLPGQPSTRP